MVDKSGHYRIVKFSNRNLSYHIELSLCIYMSLFVLLGIALFLALL